MWMIDDNDDDRW